MKKLSLILALFAFVCSSTLIAEAKILTCERVWNEGTDDAESEIWTAVFDTDDFKKDNSEYELTYLKSVIRKDRVGDTYRLPMSVTPSTISFTFCVQPKSLVDSSCRGFLRTNDVSRKDLTYKGGKGKCEIADYGEKNIL